MGELFLKRNNFPNYTSLISPKNLLIRPAVHLDKKHILKFCKNTFSWGDYIESAWDSWIHQGNLIVIEEKNPIAICHVFFSKTQLWIEGIRIHPLFQRKGLASKLISYAESLNTQNTQIFSLLVNSQNTPCLELVRKLGYEKKQEWYFYSLSPKSTGHNHIQYLDDSCVIPFDTFVDSWRWLPAKDYADELLEKKQVIYSDLQGKTAYAVIRKSDYFENVVYATIHVGSKQNNDCLISYLQELGHKNDFTLQIIASNSLCGYDDLKFITKDYYFLKNILNKNNKNSNQNLKSC
jgi:GNAT superfamily N-acetyltransferase